MDRKKLEAARKKILEAAIEEENKPDASETNKSFARLVVAQRTVQDKMYDIGKNVLMHLTVFEDEQSKQNLAALAEYYELMLAGLETFEKSLKENQ